MNIPATSARWAHRRGGPHRSAVTLIELLFVMMIVGLLAAISLVALTSATEQAREARTRAIISRLDQLIMDKYESYLTRAVPIRVPPGTRPVGEPFQDTAADNDLTNGRFDSGETYTDQNGNNQYDMGAGEFRLFALRELMRLEMPCLKADVVVGPVQLPYFPGPVPATYNLGFLSSRPALNKAYLRKACANGLANWTEQYEGAECLYLIVSAMRDGEDTALSFFAPSEIGDIDADGMLEIHDAWGNPIEFVRWPAGYSEHPGSDGEWGVAGVDDDGDGITDNSSEAGWPLSDDIPPPPTPQTRNFKRAPDLFDPLKLDGRYRLPNQFIVPFTLKPLVYSAGPDEEYDIQKIPVARRADQLPDATSLQLLDPYRVLFVPSSGPPRLSAGSPYDPDGRAGYADNLTNHEFSEN